MTEKLVSSDIAIDGLRTALIAGARAGDCDALEALIGALPDPLPPRTCRQLRDQRIRRVNDTLRSALPSSSPYCRARLIATAGSVLAGRRDLPDAGRFALLDRAERMALADQVRPLVGVAPWPAWRQILAIIR